MLLLHISDIHFRTPDCLNSQTDPDYIYRTYLLDDVRRGVGDLGPVNAILVTGDIAFKGDRQEYECALAWLIELAAACGCPMDQIYVTPGNHDVDRRMITEQPAVRNVQNAILAADKSRRERELRTQFANPETGRSLLTPHTAYNEFAKLFECQIYSPEQIVDLRGSLTRVLH